MTTAPNPDTTIPSAVMQCLHIKQQQQSKCDGSNSRLQVRFSTLDICELSVKLASHQRCADGAAMQLGDQILVRNILALDKYELERPLRRKRKQMRLGREKRVEVLLHYGCTMKEINESYLRAQELKAEYEMQPRPRQRAKRMTCKERNLGSNCWDNALIVI